MTKITFENLPSTNTPLSAENLNLLQDNVETAINVVDTKTDTNATYSTSETRIGTWIDGKPIYRKVFTITNPASSNTNYENLSSLNINRVIHLYGYYKNPAGTFGIPFTDSDSNFSVMFVNGSNQLIGRFASASIPEMQDIKVIIEYTKTTD